MFKKIYEWTAKIREKLSEKGQGMVEYALVLAAVAIIAVVAVWGSGKSTGSADANSLEGAVKGAFESAAGKVNTATNGGTAPANDGNGG